MPELPEIETIKLFLKKHLLGKTIASVDIREPKQFHGDPNQIIGATIVDVLRKGKVLTLQLSQSLNITIYASFHLKLSGQILFSENKNKSVFKYAIPRADTNTMPAKTTRIILYFTDDAALYFNDMRKFGWLKLGEKPEGPKAADVLSEEFTADYLKKAIAGTTRAIKIILLDQDRMAGIGNIYANDSLWEAKIRPSRRANSLSNEEIAILHTAIMKIIHEGIKYKGSSAHDELYMLPDSEKGQYQKHFKAYHQHGKPCARCQTIIQRIELGGRGTFFCPLCQK